MNNVMNIAKDFVSGVTTILISLLGLGVVSNLLFGNTIIIGDVVANITNLVTTLGNGGLVGLIVAMIVISLFLDKK
tara:strand:- start:8573 stop:8800 length:228 start_codon:yes stop_codon:yes gene_type:complete